MRILVSVICLCILHLLVLCLPAQAQTAPAQRIVIVSPRTDWAQLSGGVTYLRDPQWQVQLDDLLREPGEAGFQPLRTETPDFGYTQDRIWLRFEVENRTRSEHFRIAFHENFLQDFTVWQVSESGEITRLERQDQNTAFSTRAVPYPELVVPLNLAEGARSTIFVRYWSGGSSELSWTLFDTAAFADWAGHKAAKNFIYYGMMLLLISGAFITLLVTRRGVFGAYAFYALFAQLFVMHADGNTFQYLWPGLPRFNAYATVPLGAGLIISGALFGRSFLQTRRYHRVFDRALLAMIVIALAMMASTIVVDTQPVKHILIIMAFLTTLLLALAGFNTARTRFREVRFYVIAWVGAVISSGMMVLSHWFGIEISEELQYDSIRMVLVMDAIMMGLAILDRFNQMKRAEQSALEASLAEARKSLQLGRRLLDLEKQVDLAERLSSAERQNLKETVHDLRQPLNALRLNIRHLSEGGQSPGAVSEIERTIAYLEELTAAQLGRALERDPEQPGKTTEAPGMRTALGPIIASVVDMFASDAEDKGISLRMVETGVSAAIPPLDLMRLLTNLVANAVKATEQGGVLIGLRRAGGLRIEVLDTGVGMDDAAFRAACGGDGGEAESGLGLAIVHDIARRYGLRCDYAAQTGRGTCLRLWLNAAENPPAS